MITIQILMQSLLVRPIRAAIPVLFLTCALLPASSRADIEWVSSRNEAVARATQSGKLILVLAGRTTCGNCNYMKNTVCESGSVRPVLEAGYVCWFCPVDSSTEWYSYASGLGGFSLPLICILDPGDPLAHLDRSTGIIHESEFSGRVTSHLPAHPPRIRRVLSPHPVDQNCEIHFVSETGHSYRIQSSPDMKQWQFEGDIITGDGSVMMQPVPDDGTAQGFFRLMAFR